MEEVIICCQKLFLHLVMVSRQSPILMSLVRCIRSRNIFKISGVPILISSAKLPVAAIQMQLYYKYMFKNRIFVS